MTALPDSARLAQLPMSGREQKANIGIVVTWRGSSGMTRFIVAVLVVWWSLKCSLHLCRFPSSNEGSRRTQERGGWWMCAGNIIEAVLCSTRSHKLFCAVELHSPLSWEGGEPPLLRGPLPLMLPSPTLP